MTVRVQEQGPTLSGTAGNVLWGAVVGGGISWWEMNQAKEMARNTTKDKFVKSAEDAAKNSKKTGEEIAKVAAKAESRFARYEALAAKSTKAHVGKWAGICAAIGGASYLLIKSIWPDAKI